MMKVANLFKLDILEFWGTNKNMYSDICDHLDMWR